MCQAWGLSPPPCAIKPSPLSNTEFCKSDLTVAFRDFKLYETTSFYDRSTVPYLSITLSLPLVLENLYSNPTEDRIWETL
jgi:hypothetical protein